MSGKHERRKTKPAALTCKELFTDALAGIISGLITEAIKKLLKW